MLIDHHKKSSESICDAVRRRTQVGEYGSWIQSLANWNWMATITLAHPRGRANATAHVRHLLQDIADESEAPVGWFLVGSRGLQTHRLHYHALIVGVAQLSVQRWEREAARRFGQSQIQVYDPSQNGAIYLAANALSDDGEFEVGGGVFDSGAQAQKATASAANRYIVYVAAAGPNKKSNTRYAWLQRNSGKNRVRILPGLTKAEAQFRGLFAAIQNLPTGATAKVFSDSPLCSPKASIVYASCQSVKWTCRLMEVRRIRRVKVTLIQIPVAQNAARVLL